LRLAADWRHSSTSHTCVMPLYTSLRSVRRWLKRLLLLLLLLETQIFVNNLRNWWSIDPPASREISLTVWWLWCCPSDSATATQLCRRFHQCAHCVCRLSTVPNFTSSLWMLFFVQPLSKNSVISTERCNLYIHTDVWSKLCLFYWTVSKLYGAFAW